MIWVTNLALKVALTYSDQLSKDSVDLLQQGWEPSEEESQPENLLAEPDTAAQPVDESEGIDD